MLIASLGLFSVVLIMVARKNSARTDQAIVLGSGVFAFYLSQSEMTTIQIMRIVYPAMASLSLIVCLIMLYRHAFLLENRGLLLSGLYFGLVFLASGILALVTGERPVFDFDTLRPYLVSVRYLMVVLLLVSFSHQVGMCRAIYRSLHNDKA